MVKEPAAAIEPLAAGAIGEEPKVANAHKPGRRDVQEEPAEKLVDRQGHHLAPVMVGIVLPGKPDDPLVEADQPVVGEGDPMGIASEVLEHLRGAGKGPLGIHDPVPCATRAR